MNKDRLKDSVLIASIVKGLRERSRDEQIGKTIIQKLMYIFARDSGKDLNYSMYHYGPFSKEVASSLDHAKYKSFIDIEWVEDEGYHIDLGECEEIPEEKYLDAQEKERINNIIEKYGDYKAIELSIIATAMYVKDEHEEVEAEELIKLVHSLKSKQPKSRIKHLLEREDII